MPKGCLNPLNTLASDRYRNGANLSAQIKEGVKSWHQNIYRNEVSPESALDKSESYKKLFKFICLGHREGISRDGAAFFKGG